MSVMVRLRSGEGRTPFVVGVVGLVLVAAAIRFHHLDHESLFMDEIRQVSYYPHGPARILYEAATQQQTPLDYWIGHLFARFSGSDFAARLPSALWGVGSVALLPVLLARSLSWPVALGTGTLLALVPFHIHFSQEARPYSLPIFLVIALLGALESALRSRRFSIARFGLLFAAATLFLLSRALTPLVVTTCLGALLVGMLLVDRPESQEMQSRTRLRYVCAVAALLAAVLLFIPAFRVVLSVNTRGLAGAGDVGIAMIVKGISRFSFTPLWEAYRVQTEPLGFLLFPLLILSPVLTWKSGLWNRSLLCRTVLLLLPASCFLELVVFLSKSSGSPYRPPYAVFLLPLVLMVSAYSFQGAWDLVSAKARTPKAARPALVCLAALAFILSTWGAIAYKVAPPRREDWRGVAAHLRATTGPSQVLVFDSLAAYGVWEPTFYGFSRYNPGMAHRLSLAEIPSLARSLSVPSREPVFILFHYRNHFLTPSSSVPYMPIPGGGRPTDLAGVKADKALAVTEYPSFLIVRLSARTGNLARDILTITDSLLSDLAHDSSVLEMHLAAAALERALALGDGAAHLERSLALAPDRYRWQIGGLTDSISRIPAIKPESR